MTTNSQVSKTEPIKKQKQKQTKHTTRIERESQKWRSHGGLSVGRDKGENGEKVQEIDSLNVRYKIDKRRLR